MMNTIIQTLKKDIFSLPQIVLDHSIAIYVYGSVARGDADFKSDSEQSFIYSYK